MSQRLEIYQSMWAMERRHTDGHERTPILALYRTGGSIVGVNSLLYDARASAPMLSRLAAAFDTGALALPASPLEVPLASGVQAYRTVEQGHSHKIVLTMDLESS